MSYANEEETLESAKSWLKENVPAIIIGLVIGLGGYFGWTYWQNHQNSRAMQASVAYENFMVQAERENSKLDEITTSARAIENEFGGTIYATFTSLALAKKLYTENQPDEAVAELQKVVESTPDSAFVKIALLRQARILLASKKYDEALQKTTQGLAEESSFAGDFLDVKGDIALAKGNYAEAKTAWQQAIEKNKQLANLVQLKLDNLPATTQPKS